MQGVSKVEALRITGTVFQNAIALALRPARVGKRGRGGVVWGVVRHPRARR